MQRGKEKKEREKKEDGKKKRKSEVREKRPPDYRPMRAPFCLKIVKFISENCKIFAPHGALAVIVKLSVQTLVSHPLTSTSVPP